MMVQGLLLGPTLAAAGATALAPIFGWLLIYHAAMGLVRIARPIMLF